MHPGVVVLLVAFGLMVVYFARLQRAAGPRTLDGPRLARARTLLSLTAGEADSAWHELGRATTARGLDLKFEADDDPAARALLRLPGVPEKRRLALANSVAVRLAPDYETHHVHTAGYVLRVRLRGASGVVGREVRIQMVVDGGKEPVGARIENDDDDDAAVGDWVEIESLEILEAGPR